MASASRVVRLISPLWSAFPLTWSREEWRYDTEMLLKVILMHYIKPDVGCFYLPCFTFEGISLPLNKNMWCDLGKPTTWWNLTYYRFWDHIKAGFKPFPNLFLFILSFVCNKSYSYLKSADRCDFHDVWFYVLLAGRLALPFLLVFFSYHIF